MAVVIPISISRRFRVRAAAAEAHALLANVPDSVSHFPKVHHLEDMGEGRYRWEMDRVGTDKIGIQVVYACKYESDAGNGSVTWTPVAGVGNGQMRGRWTIRQAEDAAEIELETSGEITLPIPKLMGSLAKPIVAAEFSGLVDTYIKNLTHTLGKV
jgi:hypothetical protein